MKVALSISQYFHNKENRAPLRNGSNQYAYGAFKNVVMDSDGIIRHVTSGKALCVAALTKDWRNGDNFKSAQLMGVDFDSGPDVDGVLSDELANEYAFLVYATPSSTPDAPRTRALFLLDAAISDAGEYKRLLKRLLLHFERNDIDQQCKDAVRLFYGSDLPGYSAVRSAVLPLAVLESLPPHPDEAERVIVTAPAPRVAISDHDRLHRYADVALQRILDTLASTVSHRNDALNKAAFAAGRFVGALWSGLDYGSVEAALYQAAVSNGYVSKDGEAAARATIRSGLNKGKANPKEPPVDRRPAQPSARTNGQAPAPAVPPPPPVAWKTSIDSMVAYRTTLHKAKPTSGVPLLFPYKVLHDSGGFCRIIPPGIMIGVVGLSGGMKTSFVETITDKWRQMGHHILWWGPEWDWEQMGARAIQRYGGASIEQKLLHDLWLTEEALNVPEGKRHGRHMGRDLVQRSETISYTIENWPGQSHYIENMNIDIDGLLDACHDRVTTLAAEGTHIRVAVWDYVQLLNMRSVRTEAERITQVLGLLKGFCVEHKIVGVVASQVTKAAGSVVRDGSDTLDAESGQFQRSDKFNLVITLNPVYQGSLLTNRGLVRVAKNSIGKPLTKTVYIDPSKFLWLDKEAPPVEVER